MQNRFRTTSDVASGGYSNNGRLPNVYVSSGPSRGPFHHPILDTCKHCGREFAGYSYLSLHQRTCRARKRDLSALLEETKEFWESRKRQKLGSAAMTDETELHQPEVPETAFYTCVWPSSL